MSADIEVEQTDTSIEVRTSAPESPARLFAVLADPRRHVDIDGSGMLQADVAAVPIEHVGQVFTMAMRYPSLGDYRTDNHIVGFKPARRIAWATAREGQPPAGVVWSWELAEEPDGRTRIVHRYDWSGVTDPAILARVSFPRVSAEQLQGSVSGLVAAAR